MYSLLWNEATEITCYTLDWVLGLLGYESTSDHRGAGIFSVPSKASAVLMVLKHRPHKMTSEQPLKKKLRRGDETEHLDETDFINNLAENGVPTDLQALHLSLPVNVNEEDVTRNTVNLQFQEEVSAFRTSECESKQSDKLQTVDCEDDTPKSESFMGNLSYITHTENISIQPAPDIVTITRQSQDVNLVVSAPDVNLHFSPTAQNSLILSDYQTVMSINYERYVSVEQISGQGSDDKGGGLDDFQNNLIKQCICGISDATLRRPFEGQQINDSTGVRTAMLSEWSIKKVLQFLSNLQLLFDVYLKQNNKGFICSRIVTICDTIVCNEYNLIEQIISLCDTRNKFVNFLAARVLSSFLIIAKTNINNEWLEMILNFLTTENIDYDKMNFALEVVKRVVEWKDIEIHVLEDAEMPTAAGSSSQQDEINVNCVTVKFTDSESFDTSAIKGLIVKSLESKWPELIHKVHDLILHNTSTEVQTCILTFLALWESIISVKANLSVIDTKPFYVGLQKFISMLNINLSPLIWKQLLSLFNEVLCYGSTLALQDTLPDDTCQLAHCVVRYVKDYRLLDRLPYRRDEGLTVNSFVGTITTAQPSHSNIDKTLLQKMVLLVLKSVAITIKETRSDSSDSSVGSDDYDFYQDDMQRIERSIRDVLKKLICLSKTVWISIQKLRFPEY
ncbi:hypothetical protein NQ315_004167 [Exocentrus adspersus]|uniref:Protein Lines N-terminal domain-containing protein n=1 Tax=Exocentrus adspersus TaxID=1586481 RepID=A0AAV8W7A3_9CUCU|nr:hypothetical protein NQ315_004167 [Exocentrus adspersus]